LAFVNISVSTILISVFVHAIVYSYKGIDSVMYSVMDMGSGCGSKPMMGKGAWLWMYAIIFFILLAFFLWLYMGINLNSDAVEGHLSGDPSQPGSGIKP